MDTLKKFTGEHPQITSWIVLAIGMVIILVWSAREVGFTPGQWTALVITTILLAGACVWIIGWEDEDDEAEVEPVKAESEAKESQS
ncbi:MAG: hypothetical protein L6R45_31270 [Anaerolineae bacterium]|nr:hypothetical protein [Anaerolineae bacterium]